MKINIKYKTNFEVNNFWGKYINFLKQQLPYFFHKIFTISSLNHYPFLKQRKKKKCTKKKRRHIISKLSTKWWYDIRCSHINWGCRVNNSLSLTIYTYTHKLVRIFFFPNYICKSLCLRAVFSTKIYQNIFYRWSCM